MGEPFSEQELRSMQLIQDRIAKRVEESARSYLHIGFSRMEAAVWYPTVLPDEEASKKMRFITDAIKADTATITARMSDELGIEVIDKADPEDTDVLTKKMVLESVEAGDRIEQAIKKVITPGLTTAKNVETTMMSLAYCWKQLGLFAAYTREDTSVWPVENERMLQVCRLGLRKATTEGTASHYARWSKLELLQDAWMDAIGHCGVADFLENNEYYRMVVGPAFQEGGDQMRICSPLGSFLEGWIASSFARVEVTHKLAAALALTDVPEDIPVHAPWPAWVLHLPPGVLDPYVRVILKDTGPIMLISSKGEHFLPTEPDDATYTLITSLARGVCLALSNPEDFKRTTSKPGSKGKRKRGQKLPVEQALYLLSAPVKVDLREEVARVRKGGGGGVKKVQWLVRGHWRNQPCGKGRLQRKTIWIEPFWKGPEEARILLRAHSVED